MGLIQYINRHSGETAWLFGKGPSLSTFDFKTAGPLRAAINDVIAHVPDCKYGFANDGVAAWRDTYQRGQTLFQPARCLSEFDSTASGAVACDVVAYEDTHSDIRLGMGREALAELPTIRRGTLGSALQILHVMGVSEIYMVGFDGGGEHAPGFDWRTRRRNDHASDYNAIRNAAIDAAHIMGIRLKFHNQDNDMKPNGKIYVRFTRNAMADAKPYCIGEIAAFTPDVATALITCRAAEIFTPPAHAEPDLQQQSDPAPIETAEAKMPERETATVPKKRARGKR